VRGLGVGAERTGGRVRGLGPGGGGGGGTAGRAVARVRAWGGSGAAGRAGEG
jgi:hypothetical protein